MANYESRNVSRFLGVGFGICFVAVVLIVGHVDFDYKTNPIISTAYADDDDEDEEEDHEDEEDEDDDDRKEPKKKSSTETRYVTHYEVRQVSRVVTVVPEEYRKDTDGDRLVDAIDPDPLVPQQEYFTDTDGDGVPNVFDQHHDEDDFAYFDSEYDTNDDGIIDSFEQLAWQ